MTQCKKLERILADMRAKAVPFAQRNTINDMAFDASRQAKAGIKSQFVNRSTWTQRSIRVERARTTSDYAEVGSTEAYMLKQERGGTGEKYNPTGNTTGESPRVRVRRKAVRPSMWINKLNATRGRGRFQTRAQANVAALKEAKASGQRFVVMDRGGGRRGLYRVLGTKKKPKSRLLYRLRNTPNVIKPKPWLAPATQQAQGKGPSYYFANMRKEIRRLA